jgi:DNA-binding MarR family transcriptional regulator/GNAT superfamily N-acetyltransferase
MSELDPLAHRVAAIRRFSRAYTGAIGVLREHPYDSRFSLTEARVLYELATRQDLTATEIGRGLGLDSGYLSRILQRFVGDGLLRRDRSPHDGRETRLTLTEAGHAAFAPLDAASVKEIGALLGGLPDAAQAALVSAMGQIETLLPGAGASARPWLMRPPKPGDIGWVVARHAALYASEYGFDARFEALVAKVAGAFLESNDPSDERCWIAERDGVNAGSIFLVRGGRSQGRPRTAKLRLLLVEPTARGVGIGRRLVAECVEFARAAGYRRVVLWTNDILTAARHLYVEVGFRLVASKPHRNFGPPMVGEDWALELRPKS